MSNPKEAIEIEHALFDLMRAVADANSDGWDRTIEALAVAWRYRCNRRGTADNAAADSHHINALLNALAAIPGDELAAQERVLEAARRAEKAINPAQTIDLAAPFEFGQTVRYRGTTSPLGTVHSREWSDMGWSIGVCTRGGDGPVTRWAARDLEAMPAGPDFYAAIQMLGTDGRAIVHTCGYFVQYDVQTETYLIAGPGGWTCGTERTCADRDSLRQLEVALAKGDAERGEVERRAPITATEAEAALARMRETVHAIEAERQNAAIDRVQAKIYRRALLEQGVNAKCSACGGPAYEGLLSRTCVRPGGCERPKEIEPSSVDQVTHAPRHWTIPEVIWRAGGHGVYAEHPIRETAIEAWRAKVKATGGATPEGDLLRLRGELERVAKAAGEAAREMLAPYMPATKAFDWTPCLTEHAIRSLTGVQLRACVRALPSDAPLDRLAVIATECLRRWPENLAALNLDDPPDPVGASFCAVIHEIELRDRDGRLRAEWSAPTLAISTKRAPLVAFIDVVRTLALGAEEATEMLCAEARAKADARDGAKS